MPVLDPAAIAGIISDLLVNIASYAGVAALLYSIGGILIRTVGWTFDKVLVNFIGYFYKYFETIIDGTLLTDSVVEDMMNRVYLLVGVFVVFRLGMLLFNYILNPSEVMDEKVGVNALVQRVIIGLILILFMPNIFRFAFRLQKAILDDQVIERIIMSDAEMSKVNAYKNRHGMGKIIGMTIFRGFFNISANAASNPTISMNFNKATDIEETYDLSVIDQLGSGLGSGILYQVGDDYAHDYFPIFSTVVLCYVLYLLVQYCLDAVVRSFKLSVLQVIAPIVIVEYMINNDRNEVFKSWKKAVISTFAMLFMRVASIWFVAYVTMLMQPGMIDGTSLLQTSDNLLKALIVLGLLAFMMDFPKLMSDVFGLDLDQSGSVKNVMGKAMGGAVAGLAIGGAAAGAMVKPMKGAIKTGASGIKNVGSSLKDSISNSQTFGKMKESLATSPVGTAMSKAKTAMGNRISAAKQTIADSTVGRAASKVAHSKTVGELKKAGKAGLTSAVNVAQAEHLGTAMKAGALAIGGAVLASNQVTKSLQGGYQQASGAVDQKVSAKQAKEEKEREQIQRQREVEVMEDIMVTNRASYSQQTAVNQKLDEILNSAPKNVNVTRESTVTVDEKQNVNVNKQTVSDVPVTKTTNDARSSDYGTKTTESGIILGSGVKTDQEQK